jgi:hypothetical protein
MSGGLAKQGVAGVEERGGDFAGPRLLGYEAVVLQDVKDRRLSGEVGPQPARADGVQRGPVAAA